jgi:diguanylate cyclase (GGDEF)-like protein
MTVQPGSNPLDPGLAWDSALDVVPFPTYVVDIDTLALLSVNRSMRQLTGAAAGQTCYRAIYQQDTPCLFCKRAELAQAGGPTATPLIFEHFNEADNRWYQLQEALIPWHDGRVVKSSTAVDISQLKAVQNALAEAHADLSLKSRELERAAATDNLTGLLNRRRIDQILAQEFDSAQRYSHPLSVILVDIDHFKAINDSLGHLVGDQVLQAVAATLAGAVRKQDCVSRWGGEEFLIVCPHTDLAGALSLAEHLRQDIERAELASGRRETCSFGVAELPGTGTVTALLERADAALYRAKRGGRNRVEAHGAPGEAK